MKINTCCFIGHRIINETEELKTQLCEIIEKLIVDENVDTFLFGSKSRFNSLCLELVSEMREKHPHIKRVYIRAEYPLIDEDYKKYLLKYYEDTYYPKEMLGAGKSIYVKRNFEMINKSRFCVIYYDSSYCPDARKSGTKIAFDYATKNKKRIIKLP